MSDDLVADAMLPSHERLVELHRRLDPSGTSLCSVEELVVELQDDLEQREAALGRALALLRTAWDLSADRWPLIEKLRTHHLLDALEWRDVQDWVINEPKEETVDEETPQVMEVANPAERAAAGVDESLARWRGISDEDLKELRAGALERHGRRGVSPEYRERAGRLVTELRKVLKAREAERTSYRGPGCYRSPSGRVYEVLGTIGAPDVMKERTQVAMRNESQADRNILMTVTMEEFNHVDGRGRRYFEYLRPLEGDMIARAAVTEALNYALAHADNALEAVALIGECLGV